MRALSRQALPKNRSSVNLIYERASSVPPNKPNDSQSSHRWYTCASLHISDTSAKQWIIPQSIQIIVAGLLLLLSFLCEESPRYLCKVGDRGKARRSLGRLWNLPRENDMVSSEIESIQSQLNAEQEQATGQSWATALKELLMVVSNQRRFLFVLSEQILSQWSGANSITSTFISTFYRLSDTDK